MFALPNAILLRSHRLYGSGAAGQTPHRAAIRSFLALLAIAVTAHATVLPDAAEARRFGAQLQRDFAIRNTAAIMDRLDFDAVLGRVLSPDLAASEAYPKIKARWEPGLEAAFSGHLASLASFHTMIVGRVILAEDARALECLLLDHHDRVEFVTLPLREAIDGKIQIVDVQIGGNRYGIAGTIRLMMLLVGTPLPGMTSADEFALRDLAAPYSEIIKLALDDYRAGKYDAAFGNWSSVSPELKQTWIWRELRDRMAFAGCVAARHDLETDIRHHGPVDAFAQLAIASDKSAALAAVDQILREHDDLAFFRVVKARLLLDLGRPAEAFSLASDVMNLTPLSGSAYATATEAAEAAGRRDQAIGALRRWAISASPLDIDRTLATQPNLEKLRSSAEYQGWLKSAEGAKSPADAASPIAKP